MTATAPARPATGDSIRSVAVYGLAGIVFGFVLFKTEIISWLRIQEMFRFQSPRMYLIIGSALAVAAPSLALLRHLEARALTGERIRVEPKDLGRGYRYWIGGALFGVGWALTGACPGPMFARIGSGALATMPMIAAALAGAWLYGWLRPRLPH